MKRFSSIKFQHKREMIWVNYLISDEICQKNANAAKCGKNVKCGHFCSNAHGNAKLMNNFFWHSVVRKSMWCKEDINKGQI